MPAETVGELFSRSLQREERTALQLLRALLRECTYLPDPAARSYLRSHIVSRFRDSHPSGNREQDWLIRDRQHNRLKEAAKQLRYLERANAGELKPLERVLLLTYGRVGKRRHELMRPMLQPGAVVQEIQGFKNVIAQYTSPTLPTNVELQWVSVSEPSTPAMGGKTIPLLTHQLQALAKSQSLVHSSLSARTNLKETDLSPQILKENAWARPLPVKRQVNAVRQWNAHLLNKILPPLPETEWHRLRDLTNGTIPWEGVRKRRPIARQAPPPQHFVDTVNMVRFNVACRNQEVLPCEASDAMLFKDLFSTRRDESGLRGNHGRHEITPRLMRKLWGRIFAGCPLMEWNSSEKKWHVRWGFYANGLKGTACGDALSTSAFRGVNEGGEVLLKPSISGA